MMAMLFRNFTAAERKRNLLPFGLLRPDNGIAWIDDNPENEPFTSYPVPFSATPVFEVTNGYEQKITLTANVTASSITYHGLSTVPDGKALTIRIKQDSSGQHTFALPPNLVVDPEYTISLDANTVTRFDLVSNSADQKWEFLAPPVIYPAP